MHNPIRVEKKTGGGIEDSELIKGIILDKERLKPSFLEFYDTDGNGKADATLFKVQVRGGEYKIVLIGLVHGSEVYKKVEPQLKGISPFDPLPMISQKYKPSN